MPHEIIAENAVPWSVITDDPVVTTDEMKARKQFHTVKVWPLKKDGDGLIRGEPYTKERKHTKKTGAFYPSMKHVYIYPREGDTIWQVQFFRAEDIEEPWRKPRKDGSKRD